MQPLGGLTARALADLGRIDEARALITKLLSDAVTAEDRMYQLYLRAADARLSARRGELSRAGPVEWVEQAVEKAREFGGPQWLYADAERRWKQFEMPWERAHALLGHGRCLLALGRPAGARQTLHAAREIFASLGAAPARTETDKCRARAIARPDSRSITQRRHHDRRLALHDRAMPAAAKELRAGR